MKMTQCKCGNRYPTESNIVYCMGCGRVMLGHKKIPLTTADLPNVKGMDGILSFHVRHSTDHMSVYKPHSIEPKFVPTETKIEISMEILNNKFYEIFTPINNVEHELELYDVEGMVQKYTGVIMEQSLIAEDSHSFLTRSIEFMASEAIISEITEPQPMVKQRYEVCGDCGTELSPSGKCRVCDI